MRILKKKKFLTVHVLGEFSPHRETFSMSYSMKSRTIMATLQFQKKKKKKEVFDSPCA
jgi:hypothetical protein